MRNLLFVMTLLVCGCAGAIKVVPTTPVGSRHVSSNPQTTTPTGSGWVLWWLGAVGLAGYATYRTFKSKS
tara:strand:+ start:625 stop:834 length:210 start_codon:yes stop_codon:yes gene_type:complete